MQDRITYKGINSYTHKWDTLSTYGGKLTENVIQAISRDLLCAALLRLDKKGYKTVMHVHDEIIAEHPDSKIDDNTLDNFCNLMSEIPDWAAGCPVKAEGWIGKYYSK